MNVLSVTFEKLDTLTLGRMLNGRFVFVVWDEQVRTRPMAIGDGNVMECLTWLGRRIEREGLPSFHGYAALLDGVPSRVLRAEAAAIAQLLRDIAREVGREPTVPSGPGHADVLRALVRDDAWHISVRGYDPLVSPKSVRPLRAAKRIQVSSMTDGSHAVTHSWKVPRS